MLTEKSSLHMTLREYLEVKMSNINVRKNHSICLKFKLDCCGKATVWAHSVLINWNELTAFFVTVAIANSIIKILVVCWDEDSDS